MESLPGDNGSNSLDDFPPGNSCGIDFRQDAIFLPVLYGLFFIIGTPLNLMALFGLYRLIRSENVLPIYVMNLLLSDLLQLLTLPLWMDYYASEHHWHYGLHACQLMGLIFYVSFYAGIFFMCIIALERHMAIARPLSFQTLSRLRFAQLVSICIWALMILPPSIAFNKLFPPQTNNTFCIEMYPSEARFISYRLITLLLSFIIPLSFLIVLNCQSMRSLASVGRLLPEERRRIKALLMLLVSIFIVVLGPYHFIGCVKYLGLLLTSRACVWEKAVFMPYQLGRALLSLNSLLDPVLYIFLRADFRAAVGNYLPCLRRARTLSWQRKSSGTADQAERHATNSTQD